MDTVTLLAPAKINLTLHVTGRRPDGYHTIESVMQAVDLCDRVTVTLCPPGEGTLTLTDPSLPTDRRNTAMKAAGIFFDQTGLPFSARIHIEKHIPQQAGMAGGSADAAAVLAALNFLTGETQPLDALCRMGEQVGADVPFCIRGGCCLARGAGEDLTPLPGLPDCRLVVVKPEVGVPTSEAYRRVDASQKLSPPNTQEMVQALQAEDLCGVGQALQNVFEDCVGLNQVADIRREMEKFHPLGSRMTGSGSAVFALFEKDDPAADACAAALASWGQTYVCRPCRCGPYKEKERIL